ncbi:nuclear transport factor 2 family protein [Pleurocapsa sp. PCC 7319]|uniref:nuclear transport factor 2 family protein n=1 Tax=Pleurocapsa sp. PCC 7319 TaxID=118161 RepID=UPI00037903BC|nr:nuclear transport factor 2 family protein [Pleurocapsa sp. PCC 7319]
MNHKHGSFLILTGVLVTVLVNTLFLSTTLAATSLMDTEEQITAIIYRQAKAWEQQNAQAIANDFAEEAVFIAAGFKYEGKQQIQKAAQDYFQQFVNTQVKIQRIIVDGDQGAVEWDWCDQERQTGQINYAQDAIILALKEGKIIYWREYIEKKKSKHK